MRVHASTSRHRMRKQAGDPTIISCTWRPPKPYHKREISFSTKQQTVGSLSSKLKWMYEIWADPLLLGSTQFSFDGVAFKTVCLSFCVLVIACFFLAVTKPGEAPYHHTMYVGAPYIPYDTSSGDETGGSTLPPYYVCGDALHSLRLRYHATGHRFGTSG